MDTRRFTNQSQSQALERFRWMGWVMLMTFVLVQAAMGAGISGEPSTTSPQEEHSFLQASAEFNPETHQVTVKARAPANAWDSTADIGRDSFAVYEDNIRRPVEEVEVAHTPLSIGVLLENGGRYHTLNEAIAQNVSRAARELLQALNPDDRVALWTYGAGVKSVDVATTRASGLQRSYLDLPTPPSSESNFYDAVMATLPQVAQMPGRKVLIVASSGIDSFSKAGILEVLGAERATGIPVCVINMGPLLQSALLVAGSDGQQPYAQLKWRQAASQLSRMARVSGCRALTPNSSFELPALYDGLLANLRLQYVIRYQSTALDLPGTRQVTIAWVDGERQRSGHTRNRPSHAREFAQAQYQLDPVVALAGKGTFSWPWLVTPAEGIQVPFKVPNPVKVEEGAEAPPSAWLAAVGGPYALPSETLGEPCANSPCIH